MTISLEEHVARAIYEAYGFAYDGRTINGRGKPYGEWAKALKAARAAIAAVREREGAHRVGGRPAPDPAEAMRAVWPAGCRDSDSCASHGDCMYLGCPHDGHAVRAALKGKGEGK